MHAMIRTRMVSTSSMRMMMAPSSAVRSSSRVMITRSLSTNGEGNGSHNQAGAAGGDEATKQMQAKINQLEEDLKKMKQELLYCLADQENTRRIAKKDVADAKAYGIKEFAKNLIDVADILRKATDSVVGLEIKDPAVQNMLQGVKATETNLLKAFKSSGVEPYGAQGDKFDPNKHEALAKVPDAHHPPNTLYQVLRRGWTLSGRVLRAAEVVVAIPPPEIDPALLERKLADQVDEADDEEKVKGKLNNNNK